MVARGMCAVKIPPFVHKNTGRPPHLIVIKYRIISVDALILTLNLTVPLIFFNVGIIAYELILG